jgi:hypothetical protein
MPDTVYNEYPTCRYEQRVRQIIHIHALSGEWTYMEAQLLEVNLSTPIFLWGDDEDPLGFAYHAYQRFARKCRAVPVSRESDPLWGHLVMKNRASRFTLKARLSALPSPQKIDHWNGGRTQSRCPLCGLVGVTIRVGCVVGDGACAEHKSHHEN